MSNQELFQAMNMFKEGVRDLSKARTLNEANAQVKQIRESEASEMQKNQALQQLGQEFAMRMLGAGGSASDVQIGMQAMQPKIYSPQDRYAMAVASGDKEGAQAALGQLQELDTAAQAGNMAQLKSQQQFAEKQQQQQFAQQDKMMGMKVSALGSQRKQTDSDIQFNTNINVGKQLLNDMTKSVSRSGTWESRWGNKEDKATLEAAPYNFAVVFSKVVDPATGAKEGEVKAAQEYLLSLGPTSSKRVVLEKLDILKKYLSRYEKARQQAQATGKPVSFSNTTVSPAAGPSADAADDDVSKWLE